MLGIIVMIIGVLALFVLPCPYEITDWTTYVPCGGDEIGCLALIALGTLLVIGGTEHPKTLYCEACGYKWERKTTPRIQLRPNTQGKH